MSIEKRRVLTVVFSYVVGELRPDNSQGDAADGAQCGGATVLGLQASQEDTEVGIQGRRTCKQHPPPQIYQLNLQKFRDAGSVPDPGPMFHGYRSGS